MCMQTATLGNPNPNNVSIKVPLQAFPPFSPAISWTLPVCVKYLLSLTYRFCSDREECGQRTILHLRGQPPGQLFPWHWAEIKTGGFKNQKFKTQCVYRFVFSLYIHIYIHALVTVPNKSTGFCLYCSVSTFLSLLATPSVVLIQANASNSANKASPFRKRDAVNIFWALTTPEGWC